MTTFALLPYFLESARGLELIGLLFTGWMLYECIQRERDTQRILWFVVILFGFGLGPLVYFLVRVAKVRG